MRGNLHVRFLGVLRGGCAGDGVALPAHTTVFLTNNKQEVMEVLTGPERRRRWSAEEKLTMVRESFEPSPPRQDTQG